MQERTCWSWRSFFRIWKRKILANRCTLTCYWIFRSTYLSCLVVFRRIYHTQDNTCIVDRHRLSLCLSSSTIDTSLNLFSSNDRRITSNERWWRSVRSPHAIRKCNIQKLVDILFDPSVLRNTQELEFWNRWQHNQKSTRTSWSSRDHFHRIGPELSEGAFREEDTVAEVGTYLPQSNIS